MCDTLRNTRSRGRSAVPEIRFRCRSEIRLRRSFVVLIFIVFLGGGPCTPPGGLHSLSLRSGRSIRHSPRQSSIANLLGAGLSSLLLQHLAGVADALLLVGIRLAQTADVRRHLADGLAVDAGHGDVRLFL